MERDDTLPPELSPGARFGNYEIVRKLGAGGMGAVYEARRRDLNKRVALKVLTLAGSPAVVARFVQEARISASLEHPNVADCIDVGQHDGVPYLALEFLDGETLGARMARGPMAPREIVDVLLPVCSALAHAHASGVVHRDLKPDNIFLARKLGAVVPKVLDFGIAKAAGNADSSGLTLTSAIMGTPRYMSPEQARDSKHVTASSDQFALGVILWEALVGRPLFVGSSAVEVMMKVISEPTVSVRAAAPGVAMELEAIVSRLLDKDAARRFPSMRAVGAALAQFASPGVAVWGPEASDSASLLPLASTIAAPSVPSPSPPPPLVALPSSHTPVTPETKGELSTRTPVSRGARRSVRPLLAAVVLISLGFGIRWLSSRAALGPSASVSRPVPLALGPQRAAPVAANASRTPSAMSATPTVSLVTTPTGLTAGILDAGASQAPRRERLRPEPNQLGSPRRRRRID